MNLSILNTAVQEFIDKHLNSDINTLLLQGKSIHGISMKTIVEQIEAKRKSTDKLPTWFGTKGIYFPNKLNIEQTSSETAAAYKSDLISGETILDLTGGFGVDSYYFSRQFSKVTHVEIDKSLSNIATYNSKVLKVKNIDFIISDGISYLEETHQVFDCIYIDPSRRHNKKGKVFFLEDCLPNVPQHLELLFSKTNYILIKTAPLLDISVGLKELMCVDAIHVLSVNNEVKELLWVLKKNTRDSIKIIAVNLQKTKTSKFTFDFNSEQTAVANYSLPLNYLYEPNSAILKSGAFKTLSEQLNIFKIAIHSHLYTSEELIEFPGRRFKIETVLPFNKKLLKKRLPKQANITTRNFPENVNTIRNTFKIKDGGKNYLFFSTNNIDEKIVLICSKI